MVAIIFSLLFKKFLKIYFNWKLITLQHCSGFCHTLTWISHGCTCVPHPEPPFYLPPHPIPLGHPSAPALSTLSHASNLDWQSISVQFSLSVVSTSLQPHEARHTSSCPSPTPGLHPIHVHWIGDAIQPSHPLASPSPPALNLSQHQGLVKRVSSSHQVAKELEFQLQHQSFQWIPRTELL